MRGAATLAVLLLAVAPAAAQTTTPSPATPLPPAHDGVITPGGSRVDPHMPVVHPRLPGRTPVIRPPHRAGGSGPVIDPR